MCESLLGLGRTRGEDPEAAAAGLLDAGLPQHGLADSGLALEHELHRALGRIVEECAQEGELPFAADDLDRHVENRDPPPGERQPSRSA